MHDRRTVLAGTFGTLAALAGCQGLSGTDSTPTETATDASTGTPTGTATETDRDIDYGDWFADTSNFDGTVDARGQSSVAVAVGAEGNGGAFAFDPPAVHVDPGTTVVWQWTGEGGSHNVVAEDGASRAATRSERPGRPTSGRSTARASTCTSVTPTARWG